MKKMLHALVLSLFAIYFSVFITGCAHGGHQQAPNIRQFCLTLDEDLGLSRCETAEVVCYVSKGSQSCWPKPAPKQEAAQSAPTLKKK